METYYLSDAPALGMATVVVSSVAALASAVGEPLRQAARAVPRGDRLLVCLLWPEEPTTTFAPMLTTLDERLAFLRQVEPSLGHSLTVLVVPTADTGDETVAQVLAAVEAKVQPRAVWLASEVVETLPGHRGSPGESASAGVPKRAYPLTVVAAPEHGTVVSTYGTIHRALERGAMTEVAEALGTYYPVTGLVVTGDQRGRTLGFPTANLRVDARKLLPPNGVYAMRVRLPGEERATHPAAASIGVRPTFGADLARAVEVFLLDMSLDLYGQVLAVDVVEYLRPELRFESVEALCEQMARDVERTREVLASAPVF